MLEVGFKKTGETKIMLRIVFEHWNTEWFHIL